MASSTGRRAEGCRQNQYVFLYSLEVVANGSEALEPTVFLSVCRCLPANKGDNARLPGNEATVASCLARYAVLGLTDMTARLVADQSLSWANTKAIFCHNNHRHDCPYSNVNGGGLWGLPSLLQTLHQAGLPELTIVTGNEMDASGAEATVQLIQAHRSHPQVRVSAVPLRKTDRKEGIWWKLYEDPYLIVHGACPDKLEHLIYLFTCRRHTEVSNYTVAVLPCPHSWRAFLHLWTNPACHVLVDADHLSIRMILSGCEDIAHTQRFCADARALLPEAEVFFCRPQQSDSGILLRAKRSLEAWNKCIPNNILWHKPSTSPSHHSNGVPISGTPVSSCSTVFCTPPAAQVVDRRPAIEERNAPIIPDSDDVKSLQSFFGVLPDDKKGNGDVDPNEIDLCGLNDEQCSVDSKIYRSQMVRTEDSNEIDLESDYSSSAESQAVDPESENRKQETSTAGASIPKIDLVPSTNDCPHLLILGTGCAAPSPSRGSSGYGLLLPQRVEWADSEGAQGGPPSEALLLTAIMECGEGTLSMMYRHLPPVSPTNADGMSLLEIHLRHVKFIWISHAHLDHYGGLPAVLSSIHNARMQHRRTKQKAQPYSNKRQRSESTELPVLVVAPRKVLDYLAIALDTQTHIKKTKDSSIPGLFRGYTHQQSDLWWPPLASIEIARVCLPPEIVSYFSYSYRPFSSWSNVRVQHSCHNAFGFVMRITVPRNVFAGDLHGMNCNPRDAGDSTVSLAFSGDTRPCLGFVRQCHNDCTTFGKGALDYLLHEASFDDLDQVHAEDKMHSTLSEALKVAEDAQAMTIILTHFSQRYATYPPMKLPPLSASLKKAAIAFAMDGMLVPLR